MASETLSVRWSVTHGKPDSGTACATCLFWLERHGCCRSDSEVFQQRVLLERCSLRRSLPSASKGLMANLKRLVA